jgi:hypothetical protein
MHDGVEAAGSEGGIERPASRTSASMTSTLPPVILPRRSITLCRAFEKLSRIVTRCPASTRAR